jgi:hypothetical protein
MPGSKSFFSISLSPVSDCEVAFHVTRQLVASCARLERGGVGRRRGRKGAVSPLRQFFRRYVHINSPARPPLARQIHFCACASFHILTLLRFWARPTSATLLRLRLEVAPEALVNKAGLYKL